MSEVNTLPDLVGQHVVIVGAGFLGRVVERFLTASGAKVTGTTRTGPNRLDVRDVGDSLARADAVIYAVAPRDGDVQTAFVDGPAAVANATRVPLVFVSSTSVYSADDGEWVDETAPTTGILAETEKMLFARPRTAVIRCGGLYGVGRSPVEWLRDATRRERLAKGVPVAWMSWVRVEDAASAIVAALAMHREGPFNVAHAPVRRADFYAYAADLAGAPPLKYVFTDNGQARIGPMVTSRGGEMASNSPPQQGARDRCGLARIGHTVASRGGEVGGRSGRHGGKCDESVLAVRRGAFSEYRPEMPSNSSPQQRACDGFGLGKRCSTVRAQSRLGWRLAYPDYRDGLSTSVTSAVVE